MTLGITDDSNYTNIANAIRDMSAGDTDGLTLAPSEMSGAIRGLRSVWGNIEGSIANQTDLQNALNSKQNTLTFDNTPTANSNNPVKSSGIKTALDAKQNTLTFDNTPTANSNNPVKSGGIMTALDAKQDTLIKSASGPMVSFNDGVVAPAGNVTVAIEPVQAGSGDPSPDNVRPITGWTGCNVNRSGKNLLDKTNILQDKFISTVNMVISNTGSSSATVYCKIKGGETYTVSKMPSARFIIATTVEPPANNVAIDVFKSGNSSTSYLTITTSEKDNYLAIFFYLASADTDKTQQEILDTVQVELGTIATSYEPYQGDTYDISFGEAGTVYGGSLDVSSGKLTVDRKKIELVDKPWMKLNNDTNIYYLGTISDEWLDYSVILGSRYYGSGLCNTHKFVYNTPNLNSYEFSILYDTSYSGHRIMFSAPQINTVEDFITFLQQNNIYIIYKLATPRTYQLTPTEVTTLLGQNNIWADTGDVDVSYWRDEAVGKSVPSAASVYKALLDIDDLGMKRYGVSGVGESASTLTHIYDAVGMVAQVGTDGDNSAVRNDFDHALPFMRRKCVGSWTLEGEQAVFHVAAYYGDEGYTEDGSIGDYVAVECPRCYYLREGDKLVVSAHQYPGYRPFDIFCKNHNPQDTMPFAYLPAYALAMKDGKAVSLPGLDNEQGCYYDMVTRARTYADGEVGTKAMILPFAVNFYEYCLSKIEFAEQNPENILKGCISLRNDNNDTCTFIDTTHVLVNNWQTARVVGEYVAIIGATEDRNIASRQATHRIKSITRCDSSGNASSSGSYTKIEVENLGKNYFNYDTSTTYRFASRPWRTGETNSVSTPSGSPVNNTNGYYPMKYRWRENVWGNQWTTSMDLFNIKEGTSDSDWTLDWYFLPDPEEYTPSASSKPDAAELKAESPFVKLSLTTPHAKYKDGYIKSKKFSGLYPDVWIPDDTGSPASGTTYYADYAYLVHSHSVRSVRSGGSWYNGSNAGSSAFAGANAPSNSNAFFGAHLYMRQG